MLRFRDVLPVYDVKLSFWSPFASLARQLFAFTFFNARGVPKWQDVPAKNKRGQLTHQHIVIQFIYKYDPYFMDFFDKIKERRDERMGEN